jgi:ABC transport system ATP-binding/permease protein
MHLISISKLSKTIGDKKLFSDVSLGVDLSEKIGIIGINGSGKSTFLKIITKQEESDSGEIVFNNQLKISILKQNSNFDQEDSIRDHIFKSDSLIVKCIKSYEEICESLTDFESNEYNKISSEMDRLNAWEYESQIKSILNELGIQDLKQKMKNLSGGMLKKIELVKTLIEESNLLLLDEPTNHLDIDTIVWLEKYLSETTKSLVLITHDRYFLDRIVNTIFEIDNGVIQKFSGNYNYYLEKKQEMEEAREKVEIKKSNFLRKELEWLGRQPKARGTKQKARIDRADVVIQSVRKNDDAELNLSVMGKRLGKTILEIHSISKSFDNKPIINDFTYHFKKKERLGIIGSNGSGKSTLLNCISGRIPVDSGFVKPGVNTVFGYFDQVNIEIDPNLKVIEFIKKTSGELIQIEEGVKITASQMLDRFLFPPSMQYMSISKLSGGERRRLYLVQLLMKNPNFLIFDEPTNDLDIKTLSILEEFLMEFNGTVLIVSHDRYFMDRLVEGLLVFEGNGTISNFAGNYSEYLFKKESEKQKQVKAEKISQPKSNSNESIKTKNSFKDQKALKEVETKIEELENIKKDMLSKVSDSNNDFKVILDYSNKIKEIESELGNLYNRWEELS